MSNKINPEDFSIAKENKDFKKSVISRSGLTNEFTLEAIEKHEKEIKESKATLLAQVKLSDAVIKNVAQFHPMIANMSDEMLSKAAYLHETKQVMKEAAEKAKQLAATERKYRLIKKVIYDKFGFVESNILNDEEITKS